MRTIAFLVKQYWKKYFYLHSCIMIIAAETRVVESDSFVRLRMSKLDNFLHHTAKLGIPVEMVKFLLKLSLKQRFLAVYHDFNSQISFPLCYGVGDLGRRIFYLRLRNSDRNQNFSKMSTISSPVQDTLTDM